MANESKIVQSTHEIYSEKYSTEKSVKYSVASGKLFHMLKYANVTLVEYCGHKQRNSNQ